MPAALAVIIILALAGICISCSNTTKSAQQPLRNAYVTLPATGSVLLLQVNETTGEIALEARTPPVEGDTPTGLALHPSKKFLYVVNSVADTISTFNIAIDGTLSFNGVTTPTGNGPHTAVVDPSGNYLLVSNLYGSNGDDGDISVYSIDASSGVLTEVAGSPFSANQYPTAISFTHSGKFLYVTNPGIGMVSSFSFADGVLTQLSNSPVYSGAGASGLVVNANDSVLYVANPSATNLPPYATTVGNISGFSIDSTTGELTSIAGSPFASVAGSGPNAILIDPTGELVYAITPGSADSIWCFQITASSGTTNGQLVEISGSPFSLAAGGLFALFDPSGQHLYIGNPTGIEGYTYSSSTGVPATITNLPFSTGSEPGQMLIVE
ncbi:MAG: beta-propeller fold lactonase family protein [Terriglobales bacterium]